MDVDPDNDAPVNEVCDKEHIPIVTKVPGVSIAYRAKPTVHENATYALDFSGLDGVLNLFE